MFGAHTHERMGRKQGWVDGRLNGSAGAISPLSLVGAWAVSPVM